jgi:site-specific recombinase XerD
MPKSTELTIQEAVEAYLESVRLARSPYTARAYSNALQVFLAVLLERRVDPARTPVSQINEEAVAWLATATKDYAVATERLYLSAVTGFYEYLIAENLAVINLLRVRSFIHQRGRRPGQRVPSFSRGAVEDVIAFVETETQDNLNTDERLRLLRDRAFIIVLADTGLRVHEACRLKRGDIDWQERKAIVIGKGDKQSVVRFSTRALAAIKDYLDARSSLDTSSGRKLSALPVFARHDKGVGRQIKPVTTNTGRNIVAERVTAALGLEASGTITPHSFRHYFVTRVLQSSGNMKLAQELARHANINITQRYAHLTDNEMDEGYDEAFEEKKE